ncbi:hypothetical protein DOY81_001851 [Sarcophaga bullata]|nr:hypothetical protein DOY81_001851 [Sarcophaga bullata]
MELNMNLNRIRTHSLDDDDNFSAHSRNSSGFYNSLNSANNSDSECSAPISVRDMVQRYDRQFQKSQCAQPNYKIKHRYTAAHRHHSQHQLAATKSSYCGLNNYGSQINKKQLTEPLTDDKSTLRDEKSKVICCNNCSACVCCQNRSRRNTIITKMLPTSPTIPSVLQANNENKQNSNSRFHNIGGGGNSTTTTSPNCCCNKINAKDILAVENCTIIDDTANMDTVDKPNNVLNDSETEESMKKDSMVDLHRNQNLHLYNSQLVVEQKKNNLLSTDSVEQQQPSETSYQSKTTIAKTASGVRIIIDIFFDQEQCAAANNVNEIVGSRVETDIPQSRILSEFQQQVMAKNRSKTVINNNNNSITGTPAAAAAAAAITSSGSATSFNRG